MTVPETVSVSGPDLQFKCFYYTLTQSRCYVCLLAALLCDDNEQLPHGYGLHIISSLSTQRKNNLHFFKETKIFFWRHKTSYNVFPQSLSVKE